jgi:hypothetical protein
MKDHLDTLKVFLVSGWGLFLNFTQYLDDIISWLGAMAAGIYAIYKLFILHRDEKRKQNELD